MHVVDIIYMLQVDMKSIDEPLIKPDWQLLEQLGAAIGNVMELRLLGIDVIIDCKTMQYAIIDINSFPGKLSELLFMLRCLSIVG